VAPNKAFDATRRVYVVERTIYMYGARYVSLLEKFKLVEGKQA